MSLPNPHSNGHRNGFVHKNGVAKTSVDSATPIATSDVPRRVAIDGEPNRRKRRGLFPGIIFALLGLNMTIVGITVYAATSDRSFAIEPGYYDKAMHWDDATATKRASDQLGWSVSLDLHGGAGMNGLPTLTVTVTDRDGKGVEGVNFAGEMFHNARSRDRYSLEFHAVGGGVYEALSPVDRMGVWRVRLQGKRGQDTLVCERSLDVTVGSQSPTPESRP